MRVSRPSRRSSEDGSATVEAGVTISALLLLIVGTVEFGQALWTSNTMLLAIEEAGRYAMVYNQGPLDTCGAQSQAPTVSYSVEHAARQLLGGASATSFVCLSGSKH